MDSLSQIVLGASVGEACLGRKVGNKAALWGAVFGTIPDLDVLPSRILGLMDPVTEMAVHRGFSHSIVFCLLLAPIGGYLLNRLYRKDQAGFWPWTWLAFMSLFTHPILDCFTTWGTQLFWPLENRIAWKTVFVIDPLYTIPFLVMLLLALRLKRDNPKRRRYNYIGLGISTCYLLITVVNKEIALQMFKSSIADQGIEAIRYDARPTAFNSILWTSNVETKDGYYVGYRSLLDKTTAAGFKYFPKHHELLDSYNNLDQVKTILQITNGYYTVQQQGDTLIINDLRFGLMNGMKGKPARFAFAFQLVNDHGAVSVKPVERKFSEGKEYLSALFQRLKGNG